MKKIKIPSIWEDCKTKEQKEAFKKDLEENINKGKFRSFDDYMFECYMKEI